MTKPPVGTCFHPMPNPTSLALTVCQCTSITALKLVRYNTLLIIWNLIPGSLIKQNPEPWLLFIHKSATMSLRPSSSTGSYSAAVALQVFSMLVRSLLSWVFNCHIKHELERLDLVKRSLPDLSMWKAFLPCGVMVLQPSTNLNPNFNPAINWFSSNPKFLATKIT